MGSFWVRHRRLTRSRGCQGRALSLMAMTTCGDPGHGRLPLDFRVVYRFLGSTFVHPLSASCSEDRSPRGEFISAACREGRGRKGGLSPAGLSRAGDPQRNLSSSLPGPSRTLLLPGCRWRARAITSWRNLTISAGGAGRAATSWGRVQCACSPCGVYPNPPTFSRHLRTEE
jgi:hypothetical protein